MHLQICILASALLAAAGREASAAMDRITLLKTVIATVQAAADLPAAYYSSSSSCQKRVGNMEDHCLSRYCMGSLYSAGSQWLLGLLSQ